MARAKYVTVAPAEITPEEYILIRTESLSLAAHNLIFPFVVLSDGFLLSLVLMNLLAKKNCASRNAADFSWKPYLVIAMILTGLYAALGDFSALDSVAAAAGEKGILEGRPCSREDKNGLQQGLTLMGLHRRLCSKNGINFCSGFFAFYFK